MSAKYDPLRYDRVLLLPVLLSSPCVDTLTFPRPYPSPILYPHLACMHPFGNPSFSSPCGCVLPPPSPPSPPLPFHVRTEQVDALLAAEPDNAEYLDVKESLTEVIALTEDLLTSATGASGAADTRAAGGDAAAGGGDGVVGDGGGGDDDAAAIAASTAAALMTAQTVTGATCQALYDGQWYDASIDTILPDGRIRVNFTGYGTVADVNPDEVRGGGGGGTGGEGADGYGAIDGGGGLGDAAAHEVYKGVPAPKRLRVTGDSTQFVRKEMPRKLQILDEDDEATRERKRKQIKAFKGKQRAAEMDAEQNAKKSSWQNFQAKVGGKKKTGFMSKKLGAKKESMFAVPEGGRVGVVGSGKTTTGFAPQKRHDP